MWIQKTKSGKYAYTERYKDRNGHYKTVSVTLERKSAQAKKEAAGVLAERVRLATASIGDYTFHDVISAYLAEQKKTVKLSTYTRNKGTAERLKELLGGDNFAETMTAGYIRQRLIDTGKGPGTLNEYITRIKSIFRWAYRADMISSPAVADKLKMFKDVPHREKIKEKFMAKKELSSVLSAMKVECWMLLTKFLALSGLRIGEAFALTCGDIGKHDISVSKTYDYINGQTTTPKTITSVRFIHIQPELRRCVKALNSFMLRRKLLTGHPEANLWLVNERGGHLSYFAYAKYLKTVTREVLGRPLTPHSLRHTHASILMEYLPIDVISRRLGHENSRVTREIYTHLTEDRYKKDSDLLDQTSFLK